MHSAAAHHAFTCFITLSTGVSPGAADNGGLLNTHSSDASVKHAHTRLWIFTIAAMLVVGAGLFLLGRWTVQTDRAPAPPPQGKIEEAPGPDNSITTMPPHAVLQETDK